VQAARREMAATGPIPAILARQASGATGRASAAITRPSTPAPLEHDPAGRMAADGTDERLRRGAEFMLADTEAEARKEGHGWVCFWGNLLRYALHCGSTATRASRG